MINLLIQSPDELLDDDVELCVLEMVSNESAECDEKTADLGRKSADLKSSSGNWSLI